MIDRVRIAPTNRVSGSPRGGMVLTGGVLLTLGASLASVVSFASAEGFDCGVSGQDVAVGSINLTANYVAVDGIDALVAGATTSNFGDAPIPVQVESTDTILLAQNLYRLHEGRFEQIGMSWVFHLYAALSTPATGCTCMASGDVLKLNAGCATVDSASIIGFQTLLTPRSEVNPVTGVASLPTPIARPSQLERRLQFAVADAAPSLNPGATYYIECVALAPGDAADGHRGNNRSYRKITFAGDGADVIGGVVDVTLAGASALSAWAQSDPSVVESAVDVPGDGRFEVAMRVAQLESGLWSYEYALANLDSDRSGGAVVIPLPATASLESTGFHDVAYHSGEPIDGADWSAERGACTVRWSTTPWAENEHANALRWGTLYNVRLVTDAAPAEGTLMIELFKPGAPGEPDAVAVKTVVPGGGDGTSCSPSPDLDGDGMVSGSDLGMLLAAWGRCPGIGACAADLDGSGIVDGGDLGILLAAWSN